MTEFDSWTHKTISPFATEFGRFVLIAYRFPDGTSHAVLVAGHPERDAHPLVRVQSACLTGTAFHAVLCDCRQQLHLALGNIAVAGSGCLVHLDQEGRGHGLVEKVAQLNEMATRGVDTKVAAQLHELKPDVRTYRHAALMLCDVLGDLRPVRLMTNNPTKVSGLAVSGVHVAERVPLEPDPTEANLGYLRAKRDVMGHILTKVG